MTELDYVNVLFFHRMPTYKSRTMRKIRYMQRHGIKPKVKVPDDIISMSSEPGPGRNQCSPATCKIADYTILRVVLAKSVDEANHHINAFNKFFNENPEVAF